MIGLNIPSLGLSTDESGESYSIPILSNGILAENGDFLLAEDGSFLILE